MAHELEFRSEAGWELVQVLKDDGGWTFFWKMPWDKYEEARIKMEARVFRDI